MVMADLASISTGLRWRVCWARDSTTAQITDLSEDRSNKAIIVTYGLSVQVSKASLLEDQGRSADVEIIGESRVTVPCLPHPIINTRYAVEATVSVVGVVGQREFIDRRPPASVGTWHFDTGVLH